MNIKTTVERERKKNFFKHTTDNSVNLILNSNQNLYRTSFRSLILWNNFNETSISEWSQKAYLCSKLQTPKKQKQGSSIGLNVWCNDAQVQWFSRQTESQNTERTNRAFDSLSLMLCARTNLWHYAAAHTQQDWTGSPAINSYNPQTDIATTWERERERDGGRERSSCVVVD